MFRLRDLREKKGISLDKLSEDLHVNKSTLSRIENELREPKKNFLEDCAKYFNVTVDYLLGLTDNPKLNTKDEKVVQNDLKKIMDDFKAGQDGPAFYNGEELDEDELYLIEQAMEIALKTAKVKNKEKYTPDKYKK